MTPFGQPWSTLGQTLVKGPLNTLDLSMSTGNFVAFSKFHLNTSKSPNVKVVYFVEGHNFRVEWHWRFGVEMREKAWSKPLGTVHWCPENCQLGMPCVHKWLRKRPYTLYKSCRGMWVYNFGIDCLWHFSFKNLSNCWSKGGKPKWEMSL
jgi:hypothetical protein